MTIHFQLLRLFTAAKLWIWDPSEFLLKLLYGLERVQKIKQMLKLGKQIGLLIPLFGSSLRLFFFILYLLFLMWAKMQLFWVQNSGDTWAFAC